MRNRLSSLAARNKRDMGTVIEALAKRIGFRIAAGLSERVIYRELFLNGLTLLDLKRGGSGPSLTISHVAARQEVRDLVAALNLPPPAPALHRPAPRQKQPRQAGHLQDEQRAERPGVAIRRVAGRRPRPQVDDFAHRPLAGEDHAGRPRDCCWWSPGRHSGRGRLSTITGMYWMGQAPRKPNSTQGSTGWTAGRKASQPHTSANRQLMTLAEAKSLTPMRRHQRGDQAAAPKPSAIAAVA